MAPKRMEHTVHGMQILQETVDAHYLFYNSWERASDFLNVPKSTFQDRLRRAEAVNIKPSEEAQKERLRREGASQQKIETKVPWSQVQVDQEEAPVTRSERHRYVQRIHELEKELKEITRSELTDEQVIEMLYRVRDSQTDAPDWVLSPPREEMEGEDDWLVPVTFWSDWHFGEVVRSEEVSGVNEFNLDIARERIRRLVDRVISLSFEHGDPNVTYPGIVVMLGGDMISGDVLHDELTESNEIPVLRQVAELRGILIWALKKLAETFGQVLVVGVVGNHGRNTRKKRAKGRVHTSLEWNLYCQVRDHFQPITNSEGEILFEGDDRFHFIIPTDTDAHFTVAGTRYMLTHGDNLGVRGGDGLIGALGPITRGKIKTRNSEAQIGRDFDILCIGHWHQWMYMPNTGVIVNGSLKGYDEFARIELRASYQPPIQGLWFEHPLYGAIGCKEIYLDERRQADDQVEWVTFPQRVATG